MTPKLSTTPTDNDNRCPRTSAQQPLLVMRQISISKTSGITRCGTELVNAGTDISDVVFEIAVSISRALETDFMRSWSRIFSRPAVYLVVYLGFCYFY